MGYHVLHQQQHNKAQESSSCSNEAIVPIKLEQMVKQFKMHRCTLDFDYSFCKEVFKDTAQASLLLTVIVIIIIIIIKLNSRSTSLLPSMSSKQDLRKL